MKSQYAGWLYMLDKAKTASARNQIAAMFKKSEPVLKGCLQCAADEKTTKINDTLDAENDRLTWAMEQILSRSNPDSCGLCDPQNLHDINEHAREALERPTITLENYYPDPETKDNPVDIRGYITMALKRLSGDLSYDAIAAAKASLKEALG